MVSVTAKAEGVTTATVKFPTAFRAIPGVAVALAGGFEDNAGSAAVLSGMALTATSATADGFVLQVANSNAKAYGMTVRWLAVR